MADPARFGHLRLEVYHLSHNLSIRIDSMTRKLPFSGKSRVGDQIQRSSKSVPALIVEGYARRRHKAAWLNYLDQALGSADETRQHLECLFQTGALRDMAEYSALAAACEKLSAKLGAFIKGVEKHHSMPHYLRSLTQNVVNRPRLRNRESRIKNRESGKGQ